MIFFLIKVAGKCKNGGNTNRMVRKNTLFPDGNKLIEEKKICETS